MSNQSDDTATIEYAESVNTQRLRSAQDFRSEQYRLACLGNPEMVEAYEREIARRRAAREAAEARRLERAG